jgi:hypothetical protein
MGRLQVVYKVIVYSFNERKEKSFIIEDQGSAGVFEIYSGICK